jgi:TolA-binding protein
MKKLIILFAFLLIAVQAYPIGITEVRDIYLKAVKALAENDLSEAMSGFKTIISITEIAADSKSTLKRYQARSYYFLGDSYFMQKNYVQAVENYRIVVQTFQDSEIYTKALYKLGRTLVLDKKYSEGITVLNDYISKYGDKDNLGDNALYWLARGYMGMKDFHVSLNTMELILNKYPDTALAYDIRSFIDKLQSIIMEESEKNKKVETIISEVDTLKQKNQKLAQEKKLLEKISELLLIKQRLLEIKAEKISLLVQIKEQRSAQ